jgi:hypothetical protein
LDPVRSGAILPGSGDGKSELTISPAKEVIPKKAKKRWHFRAYLSTPAWGREIKILFIAVYVNLFGEPKTLTSLSARTGHKGQIV